MVQQAISLASLPDHYPAFLSNTTTEDNLLLNSAVPGKLRDITGFSASHRNVLVDAIIADLERWHAPSSAFREAARLRETTTYAVVTGQQAGIATGPLYTLYKAIGTIRAAGELSKAYPEHQFVPVFWIEGDDHDFDEARSVSVLERSGDVRTIRYDDHDARRLHVGDRVVSRDGLEAFLTEIREVLGETDFTAEVMAAFEEAYGGDRRTLGDGFARFLYALAGDIPLVLVSSRNAQLKSLAASVFAAEVSDPDRLFNALSNRTEGITGKGIPTPITPKPGALFVTHNGERISLDIEGSGYRIRGTETTLSREEATAMATEHPERFSPNVALRPVVQDTILPTAIYLGGPSEVAYLNQLRDVYPLFNIEQPAICPRPFITLVEPKAARMLETSSVSLEQLFDAGFDPATYLMDEEKEKEIEDVLAAARQSVEAGFDMFADITNDIDKSLEKALGAGMHKAGKELDNFGSRLKAALKRRNETEINRLSGARTLLLPAGSLQERTINPLYIANKYGIERLRTMLQEIDCTTGAMQLLAL